MDSAPSREAGCTEAPSGDGACARQPAAARSSSSSWPPPVEVLRVHEDGSRDIIVSPRCDVKTLPGVLTAASSVLFATAPAAAVGSSLADAFRGGSETARSPAPPPPLRPPLAAATAAVGSAAATALKRPLGGVQHRLGWFALAAASAGVGAAVVRSPTARDNARRSLRATSMIDCCPEYPGTFTFMYVLALPFMLVADSCHVLYSLTDRACTVGALALPTALAFTAAQQAFVWPGPVARLGGAALWRWVALGGSGTGWVELGVTGAAVKLGSLFVPPPTRTLPPLTGFWSRVEKRKEADAAREQTQQ
jgi:hypothetical protein